MKKKIYLTVDTECHNINKRNEYIDGETSKGCYGLERILKVGEELGIPVNVFIDISECHVYGDDHITSIVKLVQKYKQPICLHVHPDYILDPTRKHFWEYSKDEQRDILRIALSDYERLCGPYNKLIFRAGAWGVNDDTYEVLREILPENIEIIDLSYIYKSRWRCHLSAEEYGAANAVRYYKGVCLLPNTSYNGVDYFGKKYGFTLNVPDPNFGVFKKIVDRNSLSNITYTMHSWDFIKSWFFLPGKIAGDKKIIKNFKRCVAYAQKKGYEFGNLYCFEFIQEPDQYINICDTVLDKIWCLWYTYRNFARIGRSFKKYALLYFLPIVASIMIIGVFLVFCL